MKSNLLSLLLIIPVLTIAQIPSYYNDVNLNLSGTALKDELSTKITTTHATFLSYTPGVWDALKQADIDPVDNTKVVLIYGYNDSDGDHTTDRTRGVNENGGNTGDWNREHVYPKSLGNPNLGTVGPGADAHHLRPSDVQWNAARSNRKFADGTGNAGTVGTNWYPGDEWKGDVARMMLYMYLRYGNRCLPVNVGVGATLSNDPNMIDLFLQWNVEDPVSTFEDQRNQVLEGIQGNRNPFIDNPAFATQIWGGAQAEDRFNTGGSQDTEAPTAPTNLTASNTTSSAVTLSWDASTDNVAVAGYNVYQNSIFITTSNTTTYTMSGLTPETSYNFTVYAKDTANNTSQVSNTLTVTTLADSPSNGVLELFLSEYIEGASNNKALEIANFTGAAVNLSGYTLRRNVNGGSSWGTAYSLTGTVAHQDVFVVAHSSATQAIINESDATTGSDALLFNGNDPVGLFKNGDLIDVIGVFSSGSVNFAANTTLRRKASISAPNTSYNVSEWDIYPSDTFGELGNHNLQGGGSGNTGPVVLHEGSFESGWDNWIDGGGDCARYSGSRSYKGSYAIRLRDNSGGASTMTSKVFDLSPFNTVEFNFYFYAYSMESGENFIVQYYNGTNWVSIADYARGTDFENNGFYVSNLVLDTASYTFTNNSQFRIQCDASANADHIYIDEVSIIGNNSDTSKNSNNKSTLKFIAFKDTSFEKDEKQTEETELYPNPVTGTVINVSKDSDFKYYSIYNTIGQLVKNGMLIDQKIQLENVKPGVYMIHLAGEETTIIRRIVRK